MKQLRDFLILVLLLSLALGCGVGGLVGGGGEEQAVSPTESSSGEERGTATAEATPGGGAESEKEEGEEEISLSSVTSGLKDLDSYRSHFEMSFEGETDGEVEEWTLEMEIEYVRDPFAQRIVLQGGEAAIGLEEGLESVQVGDRQYVVFGGGQCLSSEASGDDELMDVEIFKPDEVIGGLSSAHRVRPDETVNGVLCHHYRFDEAGLPWADLTRAQGEVWVAVDGDYVVKYTLEAEGKDPVSEEKGHVKWVYEVRDVNVPVNIEPPASCEAGESEFPMMADAAEVATMAGMVMYKSSSSFDDVLSFYQEQMPAEGWSDAGDAFIGEGTAMLSYTKDGRTASVTLTEEEGGVSVLIMSE